MILYFSSTGNCKFVAEQLASALDDRAASILDTTHVRLAPKEKLGFVFPTYFWRLPTVVNDYMKSVDITGEDASSYVYFVATYGTTCGQTGTFMKRLLQAKGLALSASYSVKMVDDWTVWFDLSDKEKVAKILAGEGPQLRKIVNQIKEGCMGNRMKGTLPMIAVIGSGIVYDQMRKTKHLHAENSCISCGLCARECPVGAIQIQDGKPVWVKDRCAMCLHCLHSCPAFAIQYDNATGKHGQYEHP